MIIRTGLRGLVQGALGILGWELRRKRPSTSMQNVYQRRGKILQRFAQEKGVTLLLDIGANAGQYAVSFRRLGFSGRIVSFEPLDTAFSALRQQCMADPDWECRQYAVGDMDREATLSIAGNSESSSLLPMRPLHREACPTSAYCSQQKVWVVRLDGIRDELLRPDDKAFLKLDVQGYELNALRGAGSLLKQVVLIDIELSLVPLYEGQGSFVEIVSCLESGGFVPVSFENGFVDPRNGHALQVDAVFIRSEEAPNRLTE